MNEGGDSSVRKSEKGLKEAVGETGGEGKGRSLGRDRMTTSSK
jgi:hypothetical protein